MNHQIYKQLIAFWEQSNYSESIVNGLFVICLILGLFPNYGEKERVFFLEYFLSGATLFTLMTAVVAFRSLNGHPYVILDEVFNTMFEVAELITFYVFFRKIIHAVLWKRIFPFLLISFLVIATIFFGSSALHDYSAGRIARDSMYLNVVEFFCLFMMYLGYFYQLFAGVPGKSQKGEPFLLIATITLIYAVVPMPFFILAGNMLRSAQKGSCVLFDYHYLLLSILLLSIVKSFQCKRLITI